MYFIEGLIVQFKLLSPPLSSKHLKVGLTFSDLPPKKIKLWPWKITNETPHLEAHLLWNLNN